MPGQYLPTDITGVFSGCSSPCLPEKDDTKNQSRDLIQYTPEACHDAFIENAVH